MAQITAMNVLLALLGLTFHILLTLRKVMASKYEVFSLPRWIVENWLNFLIALVAAGTSLLMADVILKGLGIEAPVDAAFYKIHALLSGYAGRDIIFRLLKFSKSKYK